MIIVERSVNRCYVLIIMLLFVIIDLARYQRLLSYSILSLITSTPLASTSTTSPTPGAFEEEEEEEEEDTSRAGLLNSEGAWCWKENCDGEHCCYLLTINYCYFGYRN
jgi:hypothetical protein